MIAKSSNQAMPFRQVRGPAQDEAECAAQRLLGGCERRFSFARSPIVCLARPVSMLRVALIIFLATSIRAQPLEAPPSAAQLREWIGDKSVSSGKRVGIDYRGALERAIRRDPTGLAELFHYTVIGEMDGATGEAHSAVLFGLLQRWGDRRFAHVLRTQKLAIRKAVIDTMPMPPGGEHRFPLTYASRPH